jgi:DNA ligase (NAD+)
MRKKLCFFLSFEQRVVSKRNLKTSSSSSSSSTTLFARLFFSGAERTPPPRAAAAAAMIGGEKLRSMNSTTTALTTTTSRKFLFSSTDNNALKGRRRRRRISEKRFLSNIHSSSSLASRARNDFNEEGGKEENDLPQNAYEIANRFARSIEDASRASEILRDLSKKISENDELYYDRAEETLADSEYDLLRMKFEAVEKRFEELRGKYDDGLYSRVGSGRLASSASPSFEYRKYEHLSPMQSLKNAFSEDEVREFDERARKSLAVSTAAAAGAGERMESIEYCAELKIDGVSASLRYENGKLVRALSRGDGEFGEDITRHVLSSSCRDVPRELRGRGGGGGGSSAYPEVFEIRGEVYVEEDALEKVNERKIANGETPFKNARNAAAGVMRMKEANVDVPLSFIPHGWGTEGGERAALFETQIEFYEKCREWGFSDLCLTRSVVSSDLNELFAFHAKTHDLRDTLSHKIDGIVYKINQTRLRDRIGSDARAPKWAIAHKFVADVAITTLKSIEVQVGRTGVLTPVAILEPCELNGATIRRATLHNFFEIERKKIQIGQDVVVERAGDVIPKIIRVATDAERITSSEGNTSSSSSPSSSFGAALGLSSSSSSLNLGGASSYAAPMLCPCCNSLVSRDAEDGMVIRCNAGLKCPAQRTARTTHFASKKALDIRGLAEKQIEKLFETNAIERTSDIFTLEERFYGPNRNKEELPPVWARYENPSQKKKYDFTKNALNMFAAINDVKTNGVPLAKFIYALGIPFVGEATAKELAKTYKSLDKFKHASVRYHETGSSVDEDDDNDDRNNIKISLEAVEGVGDIVAKSIANFWSEPNNANEVQRILDNGVKILPVGGDASSTSSSSTNATSKLFNRKVCITGTFPTSSKTRSEIQRDIERLGGSVSSSLAKSTDILLIGENPGSSKLERAREILDAGGSLVLVEGFEKFENDWLFSSSSSSSSEEEEEEDDEKEE